MTNNFLSFFFYIFSKQYTNYFVSKFRDRSN